MRFLNRISQTEFVAAPDAALDGQFEVRDGAVDDMPIVSSMRLFVGPTATVEVSGRDGTTAVVEMAPHDASNDLDTSCSVGKEFRDHLSSGFTPDECAAEITFLASRHDISDQMEPSDLDKSLAVRFPSLRFVCARPEADLHFVAERQPVGRARRLSRGATERLTAHTEDWAHRSVTGIRPRVIEALLRDETADIYENRVAARLIDELLKYLLRRIATLEDVTVLLDSTVHQVQGTHWKRRRASDAWAKSADDGRLLARAAEELAQARAHYAALRALVNSPLYEAVPRRARVRHPIQLTNLFDDDLHYRRVRELWGTWWNDRSDTDTPQRRQQREQGTARNFDAFSHLLVLRALSLMGYKHSQVGSAEIEGPLGTATAVEHGDGSVAVIGPTLNGSYRHQARFVAIPTPLLDGSEAAVDRRLALVDASAAALDPTMQLVTVVTFPASHAALQRLADHRVARRVSPPVETMLPDRAGAWLVPVSALDLESQERVARVICWVMLGGYILGYPARMRYPTLLPLVGTEQAAWTSRSVDGTVLSVIRPPDPRELDGLKLATERSIRKLHTESGGVGHQRANQLETALAELDLLIGRTRRLLSCPICRAENQPSAFKPRDEATFECTCVCTARWGLRLDTRSTDRIPYLLATGSLPAARSDGWMERWFGGDALASPCWVEGEDHFINPTTGRCTSDREPECSRCRPPEDITNGVELVTDRHAERGEAGGRGPSKVLPPSAPGPTGDAADRLSAVTADHNYEHEGRLKDSMPSRFDH